jgi:hypothetical protein
MVAFALTLAATTRRPLYARAHRTPSDAGQPHARANWNWIDSLLPVIPLAEAASRAQQRQL